MLRAFVPLFVLAFGCGGESPPADGGGSDAGPPDAGPGAVILSHEFPPIPLAPYEERSWVCQSWTLENDEPIYLSSLRAENEGAWHHSNWFFVSESTYDGPDGTWDCTERDFDEIAAAVGGGVLFAQSTQSATDLQAFPPGVAVVIPPRSRVVGDVHLIELEGVARESAMRFELTTIPGDTVTTELAPMSFTNLALALPPRSRSEFSMECDFSSVSGVTPFDFRFFYTLPHYHSLATGFRLEVVDAASGPVTVADLTARHGEPWGQTIDPPIDVTGGTRIRMSCIYDNPRDEIVGYGIGDQEMCVFLAFTDARFAIAGRGTVNTPGAVVDGIATNQANCVSFAFPR